MTLARFAIKLSRYHTEPETRWFRRHILRRRERYVEEVIFSGPAPADLVLTKRLNAPSELLFKGAKIEDWIGSLDRRSAS